MYGYSLGLIGMWLFADGWFSLAVHLPDPKQTFWKDHVIRWIRIGLGTTLIIMGAWLQF